MSKEIKTHYRKAYKSDHLGVADLEELQENGSNLVFTISNVKFETGARVAGKKGDFNIAYFKEKIKPLVLNAGNANVIKTLSGSSFIEQWNNITIQLFIDPKAQFGGETTGGVRISKIRPVLKRVEITPTWEKWDKVVASEMGLADLREHYDITDENFEKLLKARSENVA